MGQTPLLPVLLLVAGLPAEVRLTVTAAVLDLHQVTPYVCSDTLTDTCRICAPDGLIFFEQQ